MMAQKHLHELLEEDQEPFVLQNYIADRLSQLQINKRKPISQNSNFPSDSCKKACFFSTLDSPDLIKKAPLFETKSQNKNCNVTGFGLFGSILKKLTQRNKNPDRETANRGSKVSVKDILKWDLTLGGNNVISEEKIEEKVMDMDIWKWDSEKIPKSYGVLEHSSAFDDHFSQSPFHFVLQTTPSPSRHGREEKENYELQSLKRLQVEEEEEKEQCSPVSVLDRPFEDDDRHVDDDDDDDDSGMDRFDLEGTYAIVQRAKQKFLQKLRRFEKLAELEKRMLEEDQDDNDDNDDAESSSQSEMNIDDGYSLKHIPDCMKRLVSDLIAEEESMKCNKSMDKKAAAERVCRRLDSWQDVVSNTIDMMVEQDFRQDEIDGWKRNEERIRETVIEVEQVIFGLLMQELSEDLVFLTGI